MATPIVIDLAGTPRADSAGLLWVHGLSRVGIEYQGNPYPFGDELVFGEVFAGLDAQINQAQHQPNYQVDEDMAGHGKGRKTTIGGIVRKVRRVTQADLASQGVAIDEPEAIMFGVELNSHGQQLQDAGQLRFSSLGLSIIRSDERLDPKTNKPLLKWSAYLREMSGCGQPVLKHLRPIEETAHLQLAEPPTPPTEMTTVNLSEEQMDTLATKVAAMINLGAAEEAMAATLNQLLNDSEGDRSDLVAQMATAAGVEVGAVEAFLTAEVAPSPEQMAAMEAILMPAEIPAEDPPADGGTDMSMAELAVVKADNQALRADFSTLRQERKREQTRGALIERAREDKIRVDLSADENTLMFGALCDTFESNTGTFEQLWNNLSRDSRDGGGRAPRAPKSVGADVAFSASPTTIDEIQTNKGLISAYRAEHGCSYSDATAALKRKA